MTFKKLISAIAIIFTFQFGNISACTGITLKSGDNSIIVARTIEWGGSDLNSMYAVIPQGHEQQSFTPDGKNGMKFTSKYGYVGLSVEQPEFITEGLNEKGLSAGLFYFPKYGKYENYDISKQSTSISDLQLVAWILGECATVEEVVDAVKTVHIINIDPRSSTAHWRFADKSGRQIVLEIVDETPFIYENKLGVLTNSPGFEWQLTNLNNYVNLFPGTAQDQFFGDTKLSSFGAGSGFLGIPGDVTPPSRFVRAAFYQSTAPIKATAKETVLQCFQILNNFDIPIGIEFPKGQIPSEIPSATQWTSTTDLSNLAIYYRTMYDSAIRCIDLKDIDFSKIKYSYKPLDSIKKQPIKSIKLK